jgi:hypothetical protein
MMIMNDLKWKFGEYKYKSLVKFLEAVKFQNKQLNWCPELIVSNGLVLVVVEEFFNMDIGNHLNKDISSVELLFQVHNSTVDFFGMVNDVDYYFAGFEVVNVSSYKLLTTSRNRTVN